MVNCIHNMSIISVEGSIGAGKTTFLKEVQKAGYHVLFEPVDSWSSEMIDDLSMIELYYKDKAKYGFAFQMYVLQSRVQHLLAAIQNHKDTIIITERCPMSDSKIFAEMMHEQGIINDYSYSVYKKWYAFVQTILPPITGVVYLRVSPETCVQRIMKRNRNGESLIDSSYLNQLHNKHESWLMHPGDVPVCVVDGNGHVPNVAQLKEFIEELASNSA